MFEKSLTDLIRGIRANKKNEQKYIQVCLQEIRNEVKSNDVDVKGVAIAKLTYVCMHASIGLIKLTVSSYTSFKCLAMICLGRHST